MSPNPPSDAASDEILHERANRMATAELRERYRAEYWALCKEFFDQIKAERDTTEVSCG